MVVVTERRSTRVCTEKVEASANLMIGNAGKFVEHCCWEEVGVAREMSRAAGLGQRQ